MVVRLDPKKCPLTEAEIQALLIDSTFISDDDESNVGENLWQISDNDTNSEASSDGLWLYSIPY